MKVKTIKLGGDWLKREERWKRAKIESSNTPKFKIGKKRNQQRDFGRSSRCLSEFCRLSSDRKKEETLEERRQEKCSELQRAWSS